MVGYYFCNDGWKDDSDLKEKLATYVNQGNQRLEILDFMKRDFDQYTWSLRTLCRRLSHFDICYTDSGVSLNEIKEAVGKELDGPGKQLGYRAMHQKIRQQQHLNVPRDVVYATMTELDQDRLEGRALGSKKKQKGQFTTKGVDWVHSLDGHCKLMGYQRFTFPLAVYGCMDSASRKLLWL